MQDGYNKREKAFQKVKYDEIVMIEISTGNM
jgi:hypothetical protein